MDYEYAPLVQQGWQCPICKRVYSPDTPMCFYCNNGEVHATTNCTVDANTLIRTKEYAEEWERINARGLQ